MNIEELTIYSRKKAPDSTMALSKASIKFTFQQSSASYPEYAHNGMIRTKPVSSARFTFRDDIAKKMLDDCGDHFSVGIDKQHKQIVLIPDKYGYKLSPRNSTFRSSVTVPAAALDDILDFWDGQAAEMALDFELVDGFVVLTKTEEA